MVKPIRRSGCKFWTPDCIAIRMLFPNALGITSPIDCAVLISALGSICEQSLDCMQRKPRASKEASILGNKDWERSSKDKCKKHKDLIPTLCTPRQACLQAPGLYISTYHTLPYLRALCTYIRRREFPVGLVLQNAELWIPSAFERRLRTFPFCNHGN